MPLPQSEHASLVKLCQEASNVRDLTSPSETAARIESIAKAQARQATRLEKLFAARALIREARIVTAAELQKHIENLIAALPDGKGGTDLDAYSRKLQEFAMEIEDDRTTEFT